MSRREGRDVTHPPPPDGWVAERTHAADVRPGMLLAWPEHPHTTRRWLPVVSVATGGTRAERGQNRLRCRLWINLGDGHVTCVAAASKTVVLAAVRRAR